MDKFGKCEAPDRDVPKLKCGYPVPCPHHTVIVTVKGELLKPNNSRKRKR